MGEWSSSGEVRKADKDPFRQHPLLVLIAVWKIK